MSVPQAEINRLETSLHTFAAMLTPNADCRPFIVAVAKDLGGKWGLNGKRGNAADLSKDVLDYLDGGTVWLFDVIGDATIGDGPGANTLNVPTSGDVEHHTNGDGAIWIDPASLSASTPPTIPLPPVETPSDHQLILDLQNRVTELQRMLVDTARELGDAITALQQKPAPPVPALVATGSVSFSDVLRNTKLRWTVGPA